MLLLGGFNYLFPNSIVNTGIIVTGTDNPSYSQNILNSMKNLVNNELALCKEITKINETVIRGNVEGVLDKINKNKVVLKGEFTLVLNSNHKKKKVFGDESIKNEIKKLLDKYSLTQTVQIVHKLSNISKNEIYKMALKQKND